MKQNKIKSLLRFDVLSFERFGLLVNSAIFHGFIKKEKGVQDGFIHVEVFVRSKPAYEQDIFFFGCHLLIFLEQVPVLLIGHWIVGISNISAVLLEDGCPGIGVQLIPISSCQQVLVLSYPGERK